MKPTKRNIYPLYNSREGFTIVEAMVAIAIIAILAGAGIQSFFAMRPTTNMHKFGRELVGAVQQARLDAVRLNACVRISFIDNDGDSTTAAPALPAVPPADLSGFPNASRGGYWVHIDDGSGAGGIACDNKVNGTENLERIDVPDHVALTVSKVAASTTDPNYRSATDSDLFSEISFNSRSLIQQVTLAPNAFVLRNHPDPNQATWWGRVVVNSLGGSTQYQTNDNPGNEAKWSDL